MTALFLSLLLSVSSQASQLSTSQLTTLECTATNLLGVSVFTLKDGDVDSRTNGIYAPYRLSGIGSNDQLNFAYVNLMSGVDHSYVSFVFPAQRLLAGERQILNGVLYLNRAVNPFAPSSNLGTPWATVSCRTELSAR